MGGGGGRGRVGFGEGGGGGGGGGIHTVTPTLLTRLACRYLRLVLLEVTFFWMSNERGGRDKSTK